MITKVIQKIVGLSRTYTAWENEDAVFINSAIREGTTVHGKYTPFILEARAEGKDLCEVVREYEINKYLNSEAVQLAEVTLNHPDTIRDYMNSFIV